jgi:undecaprenyl-diphosphatase
MRQCLRGGRYTAGTDFFAGFATSAMHATFGWLDAIILGLVQGLTEFLPISSSAHLRILGPLLPGGADPGAAFTAITQLGTELAVLIYFRKDVARMLMAWCASLPIVGSRKAGAPLDTDAKLAWLVILGTIPICVLGLVLRSWIETTFRTLAVTAIMLIVFGLILGWAEKRGQQTRQIGHLGWKDGILLGFAQAMALVPGVSRSGGTITAGLLLGMTREAAARFSFLLAIPAVLMSGVYMLLFKSEPMSTDQWGMTLTATVVAFLVGYAVIVWFMRLISSQGFRFFVIYRVVLGVAILLGLYFGFIQ